MGQYFKAHHLISVFNEFMNITEQRIRSFFDVEYIYGFVMLGGL